MSELDASRFVDFFQAIHGKDRSPFPWQERLAKRVLLDKWPSVIALPTAAGKTVCIDIAVYSLAYQTDQGNKRWAPRRIFFVVDRRVIVDQAYDHAREIACILNEAKDGILRDVADNLRNQAKSDRPLDVFQLRGGIYRDDSWARTPLQPTVIASTVDQIGSRLLYRGYGLRSGYARPIHAALSANDSLILLDEAHCARPFCQTASYLEKYRDWAASPIELPFQVVQMTATPHEEISESEIEQDQEDDRTHDILGPRIQAKKRAKLVLAKKAKGKDWQKHLVKELVKQAEETMTESVQAVGVIVNRVATARLVARTLQESRGQSVDVVLLTGRMRPIDRDKVVGGWLKKLQAGADSSFEKPVYIVATQCLEVGADLDFHGLVSECASLDALRQRFGRLNRVAKRDFAPACIVIRGDQEGDSTDDPVYGDSITKTWKWLADRAIDDAIDMGVKSVREFWEATPSSERYTLNAPADQAPVLFPAYLDCWVQTDPVPCPDPDPTIFLHGPQRGVPDVQVVWRVDLGQDQNNWIEILSLCPPCSSEAMPVPLPAFRDWLAGLGYTQDTGDVEGAAFFVEDVAENSGSSRTAVRWCGPEDERTQLVSKPREIGPGDTLILPILDKGWESFGHIPAEGCVGTQGDGLPLDYGDAAYQLSRDIALVRLTQDVVKQWPENFNTTDLEQLLNDRQLWENEAERDELVNEVLVSLAALEMTTDWQWLKIAAERLANSKNRIIEQHPLGGWVVKGIRRLNRYAPKPSFTDEDDTSCALDNVSKKQGLISLEEHSRGVEHWVRRFAEGCGLTSDLEETLAWAARWHDLGKADPRFQSLLRNLPPRAVVRMPPVAKSQKAPRSRRAKQSARELSGYPKGGRHELLSVRLAESRIDKLPDDVDRDLLLHLIASHHGRCRPLPPIVEPPRDIPLLNQVRQFVHLEETFTRDSTITKLERLDSGLSERFWKLVRKYGWWGLAFLETQLRLADHRQSEQESSEHGQ